MALANIVRPLQEEGWAVARFRTCLVNRPYRVRQPIYSAKQPLSFKQSGAGPFLVCLFNQFSQWIGFGMTTIPVQAF